MATDAADSFIHPSSYIDDGAVLGVGCRVWHFCHIMPGAVLGQGCNIGQNVFIASGAIIGNRVRVQNNVSIYDGVTLGDDVFCGPSVVFTNVINPRAHVSRKDQYRPTFVEQGATLGANCTVVCGHKIGRYALIGAGSVVTKDVADFALMAGVPARRIGWVCRCGEKLPFPETTAVCATCGQSYRKIDENRIDFRDGH